MSSSSLWSPLYIQATLRAAIQQACEEIKKQVEMQLKTFVGEATNGLTLINQSIFGVTERTDVLVNRADETQGVVEQLLASNNRLFEITEEHNARIHSLEIRMRMLECTVAGATVEEVD